MEQFENNAVNNIARNVPTQVSVWTKVRNFLLQDVKITMTPKQEKVFQEVHDFWHQEITGEKLHDFWFQEITGEQVHDFLFQEIKIVDNITL